MTTTIKSGFLIGDVMSKKYDKPVPYSGDGVCFYCGKEALYQQKNGLLICGSTFQQCPVVAECRSNPKKDLSGEHFGFWEVLRYEKKKGWMCRCVCGVEKVVRSQPLIIGESKSCGCKTFELMSASIIKPDHQRARRSIFNNYRGAATRRGHEFVLTFDEFSSLLTQECYYCGASPDTLWPDPYLKRAAKFYKSEDFYYNGVDRSDNTLGYTAINCVSACKFCNRSKNDTPLTEWLNWAKRLYEFQSLRGAACGV